MSLFKLTPVFAPILGFICGAFKIITIIKEGQGAIRMRRGRAVTDRNGKPKLYGPGLYFTWPFVESMKKLPTSEEEVSIDLPDVYLKDNTLFHVTAAVFFKITDVYKAQVNIRKEILYSSIQALCRAGMNAVLSKLTSNEIRESVDLSDKLVASVEDHLACWGVELTEFRLTKCTPDRTTHDIQLVPRRADALKEVAPDADLSQHLGAIGPALLGIPTLGYTAGAEHGSPEGMTEGGLVKGE